MNRNPGCLDSPTQIDEILQVMAAPFVQICSHERWRNGPSPILEWSSETHHYSEY